ncbi:MAG: c-type cytochrome [Anaerolineales bacterium]|nr:c-type cytochrome [Anaerolineales bacterium]
MLPSLFNSRLMRCIGGFFLLFVVVGCAGQVAVTSEPDHTPVAEPLESTMALPGVQGESWVLLDGTPENATQAEVGAEIYRLVCSTCHGGSGEGLTDAWRARLAPEDQNCWQSKCHASNHPPDGFVLPREVPPVTGDRMAARFPTAQNLYDFVRLTMPYHAPGTMLDQEYWQVTAFLLSLNGIEMGETDLAPANAEQIILQQLSP